MARRTVSGRFVATGPIRVGRSSPAAAAAARARSAAARRSFVEITMLERYRPDWVVDHEPLRPHRRTGVKTPTAPAHIVRSRSQHRRSVPAGYRPALEASVCSACAIAQPGRPYMHGREDRRPDQAGTLEAWSHPAAASGRGERRRSAHLEGRGWAGEPERRSSEETGPRAWCRSGRTSPCRAAAA